MDNATKEIVERVNKELGPHIKGYLRKEEYGNLRIMEWAQEGGDGKIRWELNFDDLRGGTLIINLCYRADKKDFFYNEVDSPKETTTSDLEKAISDKKAEIDSIPKYISPPKYFDTR